MIDDIVFDASPVIIEAAPFGSAGHPYCIGYEFNFTAAEPSPPASAEMAAVF
jgi:hypothetical protein